MFKNGKLFGKINVIDLLVITHPHGDHIGGFNNGLFNNYSITTLVDFGYTYVTDGDDEISSPYIYNRYAQERTELIMNGTTYTQINDALKRQGFGKVALNLSQIDDNESITIDYKGDSFLYQLPFTINLEHTKEHAENIISCDEEKIELDKITIFENGLIEGHDLESYDLALDKFMETLPKLRRNI